MIKLTVEDCRKLNYCSHGMRQMAEMHGFDWYDFLQNGVDIERLAHIDDCLVQQAIEVAKERVKNGQ